MIKPGKACSQLMEANNTGETKIKVVGKHFSTYIFLCSKTPLIIFELIASSKFNLIFEIRVVFSVKTCLEGGKWVKLIMHAP
jgi:hypothetical protein